MITPIESMPTVVEPDKLTLVAQLAQDACAPTIEEIAAFEDSREGPTAIQIAWDSTGKTFKSLKGLREEHRLRPALRTGTAKVTTLRSFVDLVNRHKGADSALFGKTVWPNPSLTAVIDYHTLDHKADNASHKVHYEFPITDEFKTWIGQNGQPMTQSDFAVFLEDHAAELAAPTEDEAKLYELLFKARFAAPHEMIDLSRHLEIYSSAKVKRADRLQTGERTVEFVEEHMNAKGEQVDVPGIFMIALPAFIDGASVRIPGRLRYRLKGSEIIWFYQLYRWEFWLRERVRADLESAAFDTALPAFEGAPEGQI